MRARAVRSDSAEKTVRDIRRVTRRQYSAEEKIRIVLEGFSSSEVRSFALIYAKVRGCPAENVGGGAPSTDVVSDFLSTSGGVALAKAIHRMGSAKLRRNIVTLVEKIARPSR